MKNIKVEDSIVMRSITKIIKEHRYSFVIVPFLIFASLLYLLYIFSNMPYHTFSPIPVKGKTTSILNDDSVIVQTLSIPNEMTYLSGIMLEFDTAKQINPGNVTVSLFENDGLISSWETDSGLIRDNEYVTFRLSNEIPISHNSNYNVCVSCNYLGNEKELSLVNDEQGEICYRVVSSEYSMRQRAVLGGVFFVCGIILLMAVLFTTHRIVTVSCAVAVMVLYSFLFQHGDGVLISSWGYYMLEAIKDGQISHYVSYIIREGIQISNYNIIVNILDAVILAPMYIIDKLFALNAQMYSYDYYRKILLIVCVLLSAAYIQKITKKLGYNEKIGDILSLLFMLSSPVIFGNLAMGQIDCIAILFILLSVYCAMDDKFPMAFFWISFSATIKEFALLFVFIPIVCLLIRKLSIREIIKCIFAFSALPVFSFIISHFVILNYADYASTFESNWNHLSALFSAGIAESSLFVVSILLICFLCLYKAYKGFVKPIDYLFAPLCVICSFSLFVVSNPQWMIYASLIMLFGALFMDCRELSLLLLFSYHVGAFLSIMTRFSNNVDITLFFDGIIGRGIVGEEYFCYNIMNSLDHFRAFFPNYYMFVSSAARSLVVASVIACLVFWKKADADKTIKEEFCVQSYVNVGVRLFFLVDLFVLTFSAWNYFGIVYY